MEISYTCILSVAQQTAITAITKTSGPKVVHGKTAKAFLVSLWALLTILAHAE